jgi:hypothetical protein
MILQTATMCLALMVPTADDPPKPDAAKTPKSITAANLRGKVVSITLPTENKPAEGNLGTNNTAAPTSTPNTQQGVLTIHVAENVMVPDGVRYVRVYGPVMKNGKVHEESRVVPVAATKVQTKHEDIPLLLGETFKVKLVSSDGKKTDGDLKDVKAGEHVEVRMVRPANKSTPITVAEIHVLNYNGPAK